MHLYVYFQDLTAARQQDIVTRLKEELSVAIKEAQELNPQLDPRKIEQEVIEDFINCHNFPNTFYLGPVSDDMVLECPEHPGDHHD